MGIQEATKATSVYLAALSLYIIPTEDGYLIPLSYHASSCLRAIAFVVLSISTPHPIFSKMFSEIQQIVFGPPSTYCSWCYGYMEEWRRTKLGSFQGLCRHLSILSAASFWVTQSGRKECACPSKTTLHPGTKQKVQCTMGVREVLSKCHWELELCGEKPYSTLLVFINYLKHREGKKKNLSQDELNSTDIHSVSCSQKLQTLCLSLDEHLGLF